MRKPNHIPAFPSDIDHDAFGHYLSGFTDGEGSFVLAFRETGGLSYPLAYFGICLRVDDRAILELAQSYWQCGRLCVLHRVSGSRTQIRLRFDRIFDHTTVIIPHFLRYPLRAKKARDFDIWREGVRFIYGIQQRPLTKPGHHGRIARWTDADRADFSAIAERLTRGRQLV